MDIANILEKLNNAQKILVGIGNGFSKNLDTDTSIEYYNKLSKLLEDRDYFVVDIAGENNIKKSDIESSRVTIPLDETVSEEDGEKQWNEYTGWLQKTLNRDMLVLELGVGFDMPTLVRWPFEKIAMINNKAYLCRVNDTFPQLPDEMGNKGEAIKVTVSEFLDTLYAERFGN